MSVGEIRARAKEADALAEAVARAERAEQERDEAIEIARRMETVGRRLSDEKDAAEAELASYGEPIVETAKTIVSVQGKPLDEPVYWIDSKYPDQGDVVRQVRHTPWQPRREAAWFTETPPAVDQ